MGMISAPTALLILARTYVSAEKKQGRAGLGLGRPIPSVRGLVQGEAQKGTRGQHLLLDCEAERV